MGPVMMQGVYIMAVIKPADISFRPMSTRKGLRNGIRQPVYEPMRKQPTLEEIFEK